MRVETRSLQQREKPFLMNTPSAYKYVAHNNFLQGQFTSQMDKLIAGHWNLLKKQWLNRFTLQIWAQHYSHLCSPKGFLLDNESFTNYNTFYIENKKHICKEFNSFFQKCS